MFDEGTGGFGQMTRGCVQYQRARSSSECGPVDLAPHVGLGVTRAECHSGIAGDGRSCGQTGQHLERHVSASDGADLGDHRIGRERITGDQANHVVAVLGFGEKGFGDLGRLAECRTNLDTVLARLRVTRNVGTDQGGDALVDVGIGERELGRSEHFPCPDREQSRVTRPGSHEQDPSVGVLADWAHRLFSSAVLCGYCSSIGVAVPRFGISRAVAIDSLRTTGRVALRLARPRTGAVMALDMRSTLYLRTGLCWFGD